MNKHLIIKNIIISLFCILLSLFFSGKVEAASASIFATTTEVTVGTQVTVSASVTAGAWNLTLKGADQSKGLVGQTNTTDNSTASTSISFTPTQSGNYSFSLSGDMTDYVTEKNESVNKTLTIVAKSKDSNSNTSGAGTTTGIITQSKSTEAKLKTLGIRPNDFSGFSKNRNKEDWSVEVPNSVAEVEIYATPMSEKAKVTGTGKISLKEGDNTAKIKVTAEAGNTKTYTLTIKRKTAAEEEGSQTQGNSDASLKSLGIKPDQYDFSGFKKDKTQYSVQVPEDVEEIEVYAEATSEKAKVTGTGKTQLKSGKNTLIVQVTAEDCTTQTYTIEAIRGEENTAVTDNSVSKFGLSTLEIRGQTLSPKFKTNVYEYKLELNEDLNELDIETIATDDDTTVEILGNENLQKGENTITILVRNKKTDDTATYQIIVNKNLVVAEIVEKTSWLKPSTWGKEEIIKVAIVTLLIILIVTAIVLKIKIAKEKECDEDFEFPGGKELDRALAEHQELSETAEFLMNYEPEDANKNEFDSKQEEIKMEDKSVGFDGSNYIEDIARSKNYQIDYPERKFKNGSVKRKGKHF